MNLPLPVLEHSVDIPNLLASQGYSFNESKNWYERTWPTNQGADTILEVYQKVDDKWKQLMIGYGGVTFYETDLKDLDELL